MKKTIFILMPPPDLDFRSTMEFNKDTGWITIFIEKRFVKKSWFGVKVSYEKEYFCNYELYDDEQTKPKLAVTYIQVNGIDQKVRFRRYHEFDPIEESVKLLHEYKERIASMQKVDDKIKSLFKKTNNIQ